MEHEIVGAIMDALPAPLLLLDAAGRILRCNTSATEYFGSDLRHQIFQFHFRKPALVEALNRAIQGKMTSTAHYQSLGATNHALEFNFCPLPAYSESPLVLVVCRDQSRENRVERMRSDFVANASHELRTPLTTLSGFIETMQGAAKQDEKARGEFLRLMKAQAERMSLLIDDLLSLSRIEVDEHVEPRELIDLGMVVRQAESLLRPIAKEAGCDMHFDVAPDMWVKGDANQLGQVANNLVENAIKYSGRGKRVDVAVSRQSNDATLTITDNGPGIAAHHIPRLTERFYRVSAQESRTRGGTGLGLAICKHIIKRHRGRLDIVSEVGMGSRFTVVLPIAE